MKIDFLDNEYDVNCHRLFKNRPLHFDIEDSLEFNLSYHAGTHSDKPITIHLKRKEKKDGENQYQSLPISRIQAPSINQNFPIPLLKLEVPTLEHPRQYKPKGYHKLINETDCNVVIWMLSVKSYPGCLHVF